MAFLRTFLDWETAYGKHPETGENVTLSKMTTEEYVRHPLFKAHGLGVAIDDEAPFYLYKPDELLKFLKTHPWERTWAICHHAHFDAAVLTWKTGIKPAFWGCTLSMAKAVLPHESSSLRNIALLTGAGEKGLELESVKDLWTLTDEQQKVLRGYCATNHDSDINLTRRVFNKLLPHFPADELRLIDLNTRLFSEPVLEVEPKVLIEDFVREKRTKRRLLKQCASDKTTLASGDKFAALLLTLGVDPPKKLSPSKVKDGRVDKDNVGGAPLRLLPSFKAGAGTSKEQRKELAAKKRVYPWAYAFGKSDEEFKLLLDHPDEQVRAVVEARMGVKSTLKETRSKRFYKIGSRGKFPVYHRYYGARTGRDSGGDSQNTTNMNRVDPKDPTSGALRKSLLAPEGHVLVVRDLGQIEARMLAYHSGQEDLLQLFREGGDPYNRQATLIFGYEVDRKIERFHLEGLAGKASTLGNGYGMGWGKFQESMRVGFMGMPSILFTAEDARKLGADIDVFCFQRSYRQGCATLKEEALAMKPLNVSAEDHLWHCAAVKTIVDKYRSSNAAVVALWKEAGNALAAIEAGEEITVGYRPLIKTCKQGFVMPNGMIIRYYKLRQNNEGNWSYLSNRKKKEWSYIYGGKAVENMTQGLSRIVLTDQMLRMDRNLKTWAKEDPQRAYKVVTSTYDEVVCCVPEDRADETQLMMTREMATPPAWCHDLPLKSAGGYARNYGDCEK